MTTATYAPPAVENFQAICCVCQTRYGPHVKPDGSHGYCRPCGEKQVREWFPDNPEMQKKLTANLVD
jgi:hypothetical protein